MIDSYLEKLLGRAGDDPGCDAAGELMDSFCELVARGEPISDRYAEFLAHMSNCTACREDMEGLLAALRHEGELDKG